jgi:asparagine synthase (glutamine-hydrolysing)
MPGIVGLVTKKPCQEAEAELQQMLVTLCHEPSYVSGTWVDRSLCVYAGWVARGGSVSEPMPLVNETGDIILIFSGDECGDPNTRSRLRQLGHDIADGRCSYLVHLYEEEPSFFASLNGRFQGILIDLNRGTATLFNDRYGIHRLYYHESKDAFYFAAEAKAILAVRPELRMLDNDSFGELVACGCVLENRTVFRGVHVLPSASAWVFRSGTNQARTSYFEPRQWEDQEELEPEAYYQALRTVFSTNLPRYLKAEQKVGMSLTGGLDTRMIMAWHKPQPGSLECYSFGGMFRDSQDVVIARRVAETCGQTHSTIRVGEEFLGRFSDYAERTVYLTDGCVGVNHSPDLYVNELAAQIAPIRMTGNYGGEVLRSVRAFKPCEGLPLPFRSELAPSLEKARATYNNLLTLHPLSFAVFRQLPWHHYGLLSLEETQLALRSPYLDNDFVRTVFRAPQGTLATNDISLRLIADGNAALARIRTDRGVTGQMGMAARITKSWLDFSFKAEYAYDYGMPQWVAATDHFLSVFRFQHLFLGRHKFYHFRVWYRDALSKYVRAVLLDPRSMSRSYLEPRAMETIVERHCRGERNYTSEIHTLLTLELLCRYLIDSSTAVPPNSREITPVLTTTGTTTIS